MFDIEVALIAVFSSSFLLLQVSKGLSNRSGCLESGDSSREISHGYSSRGGKGIARAV